MLQSRGLQRIGHTLVTEQQHIGMPHFTVLHFTAVYRHNIFYKLKVVATQH